MAGTYRNYGVSVEVMAAVAGVEFPFLLIINPSGSGKVVRLWGIHGGLTNTSSADCVLRLYRNPTIVSPGVSVLAIARRGGNLTPPVVTAFTSPVVTANGSKLDAWQQSSGVVGGTVLLQPPEDLILPPGDSFLITAVPDGANRNVYITITWAEDSL